MKHITLKQRYRMLDARHRRYARQFVDILLKHQEGQTATERAVKCRHLTHRPA